MSNKKWIILLQFGKSIEPAYWEEDGKPVLFDTREEAMYKMYEDHIDKLRNQLSEARNKFRELDEIDPELDEWVEACIVSEEGCISLEVEGEIYNPKTHVR